MRNFVIHLYPNNVPFPNKPYKNMYRIVFTLFFLTLGTSLFANDLKPKVDARMELLSIVARLADYPEYSRGKIEVYNKKIDAYFGDFQSHPVIETAKQMRDGSRQPYRQLQYDGVLALAVHLVIEHGTVYINPELETKGGDSRCFNELTSQFLDELNDFYSETKFQEFFDSNEEFYRSFESYFQENVVDHINTRWIESFMGYGPDNFHLLLTLLTGIYNYGATTTDKQGSQSTYASVCCYLNSNNEPTINTTYAKSIVIHEFAHYYCNPLINKNIELLEPYIPVLYSQMGEKIKSEPYAPKEAVLTEPFVRAVEILYDKQNNNDHTLIQSDQLNLGIYWMEDFVAILEKYGNDREKYRNMDDFMPRVVEFYAELASGTEKRQLQHTQLQE